jgi:RNA polymerase sigma-70 factor (ECF subfamily)
MGKTMIIDPLSDDEATIRRCQAGERDSYAVLVDRYGNMVFNVAYRMLGDGDSAKDLAQESFIAAYNGIGQFRFKAKFSTWLYSIVLNKCRDHFRQVRDTLSTDDIAGTHPDKGASPEQSTASQEDRDMLQHALDSLPDEYREVLVLKHIEELDYREISAITGAGVPALKVRAHRGREMLRKALEEAGVTHG